MSISDLPSNEKGTPSENRRDTYKIDASKNKIK